MKNEFDEVMKRSSRAWQEYKKLPLLARATLMNSIAEELEMRAEELKTIAAAETNLSERRLSAELARTVFQMRSYGEYCKSADWMDIRIDLGDPNRVPPKPDLRKMMVPLGPVIVFGAANFPFAYRQRAVTRHARWLRDVPLL